MNWGNNKKNPWQQRQPRQTPAASTTARWLAFQALRAYNDRGVYVSAVLDDLFQQAKMDSRERRFATELANATVRRQLTLDTILQTFVSRPMEDVEGELWTILQLGCLQIVCLPHVPAHAAVHETVELCERVRSRRAKPFINGVLRNLERSFTERTSLPSSPSLSELSRRTLPLFSLEGAEQKFEKITFDRDLFDDPATPASDYISQVGSLPEWLLTRFQTIHRSSDELLATALWMTSNGRLSLRMNPLQTNREQLLDVLQTSGVQARPGDLDEAVLIDGSLNVIDLLGYREGWFSVQDVSAMSATDLLAPQSGETILDLCAAPGGKTTHIAERLKGTGQIVACDTSESRLKIIQENARRLKHTNVETVAIKDDGSDIPDGPFDAVLVDVPCSNTGVLGKRPEARWRLTPHSFEELIPLQVRLLNDACQHTKVGGRVVYSTCSIDEAENQQVVEKVLAERPEFKLVEQRVHLPGKPADGGYQALLTRTEPR